MSAIAKAPPSAKMPPKQKAKTKVETTTFVKRPPSAEEEVLEPIQKFFIEPTERTFLIRFGTQQFGIVKHDNISRFENLQRNCEPKDNKAIAEVITLMKTYLKAGMSFEQLKERMSKNSALFAPSLKVFINRLNKEI